MTLRVLALAGDGIGPEVMAQGLRVLKTVAGLSGIEVEVRDDLIHGQAWDAYGVFCRDETVAAALDSHGVLVGAVGGPRWDGLVPDGTHEEQDGLMRLRRELDVFAGLRPARALSCLADRTPYRPEVLIGTDLLVLREMCGGVMFAPARGVERRPGHRRGFDTASYHEHEIARHARVGFELARRRRRMVVSVDKANVMQSGVLWREVVDEVAAGYPDVSLEHMYADNCSYQLAVNPKLFDVIITDNLFGDLLSDQAGAVAGSLGMLPSASLVGLSPTAPGGPAGAGIRPGIYEPVHGSAPDIAGNGIANPVGMIGSVAMFFEYGAGRPDLASEIDRACEAAISGGVRTPDLGGDSSMIEMADAILAELERRLADRPDDGAETS